MEDYISHWDVALSMNFLSSGAPDKGGLSFADFMS